MKPLATPVIAGNWKMNLGPRAARELARGFIDAYAPQEDRTIILFPPALSFAAVAEAAAERPDILLGVQHVHWERSGAFTGEISAEMAAEAGARFALVGHSERRHLFGETSDETRRKVRAALSAGLMPILCIGETLDERQAGRAVAVVAEQLAPVMEELAPDEIGRCLLAYEPVWAIGTGMTASPADAAEMHRAIREQIAERFGVGAAAALPILYGGSVKPENAESLLAEKGVNGLLVGGASLDAAGFARIGSARAVDRNGLGR